MEKSNFEENNRLCLIIAVDVDAVRFSVVELYYCFCWSLLWINMLKIYNKVSPNLSVGKIITNR